jgi:benzoylsuccinyl-CoA thiolase BbsB subunit
VPFRRRADETVDLLAARAVRRALDELSVDPNVIEECYIGTAKGGSLIGQRALRFAGAASGLPVFNVENACASSAVALHLAHRAITTGEIGGALVIGVDRLSSLPTGPLPVQPTEWDGTSGVTNPVSYALRARRYMHETGASQEDLAAVSVKSRSFAARNPIAQMRTTTTVEEVLASRPVADPLTLFQCSPKSDGAAALVVLASSLAERYELAGPEIRASVVRSGEFSMAERDITRPDITTRTASAAFEIAGVGPSELDVVELHDAFSIAELLYIEELGLCAEGDAVGHQRSGRTSSLDKDGSALVNPSGGLLGRGHPIGATGLAQIIECADQLRGRAGDRQKEAASTALAHVTGGGASGFDNGACCVTVLTSS